MMFKQLVKGVATAAMIFGIAANAEGLSESKPFIGLEVGYATVQGDVGTTSLIAPIRYDYEGSDVEYGIRLGAKNESWRTTLSFQYFDSSDEYAQNYEKILASFDFFFLNAINETYNVFQPYLGVNVGYTNYESTNDIDMSGVVYGAQAGFTISVADNIDIDIFYRYSLSSAEDHDAQLDHIGSIVFGIDYVY